MTADLLQALRHIQANLIVSKNAIASLDESPDPETFDKLDEAYSHINIALRQVRAALSSEAP